MPTTPLRPPLPHQIQRREDEQNGHHKPPTPSRSHSALGTVLLLSLVPIVVVSLLVRALIGGRVPAPPPSVAPPVQETVVVLPTPAPTVIPTPSCVSGQAQRAIITGLEQRGAWQEAADTAEATLATAGLCPADQALLTQTALVNGLKALYTEPVDLEPYNRAHQQEQVDRWLRYTERARLAGVDFPSPLVVAREATATSHHRLAAAAVEVALADREFNPTIDRDITKLYISALYGVCYWQTKDQARTELYAEGLSYCVTSHRLAVAFKTGQAEAAMLLRQIVSDDERTWPAPYTSPLLSSIR